MFQRDGETTLQSAVTFLEQCESGLLHSTNVEMAGAGAVTALGRPRPGARQPAKSAGKKPGDSRSEEKCIGCGKREAWGWVSG